jgi:hypothetical protein
VANYFDIFSNLPPNAQLNAQQIELIRTEWPKFAKPIKAARLLKDMPTGRFPTKYSDDWVGTVGHDKDMWALREWLRHDAYMLAHDREIDRAVESCQAILNLGRALDQDPFLYSLLVRFGLRATSLVELERVLAQGEAGEEHLKSLQAQIAREMNDSGSLAAFRGERAGIHRLVENLRSGKVTTGVPMDPPFQWLAETFPSAVVLKYYPEFLRYMNRGVEIAKLPIHERLPKLQERTPAARPTGNPIIRCWGCL